MNTWTVSTNFQTSIKPTLSDQTFFSVDMDDSCFSNVTLNQKTPKESNIMIDVVSIKDEPQSDLESPNSSCPASPTTTNTQLRKHEYHIEIDPMVRIASWLIHKLLFSKIETSFPRKEPSWMSCSFV